MRRIVREAMGWKSDGGCTVSKIIGTLSGSLGDPTETIIRGAGRNGSDGARRRYLYSLECKKSGRAQLVRSTCNLEMFNGSCARCTIPIAAILQLEKCWLPFTAAIHNSWCASAINYPDLISNRSFRRGNVKNVSLFSFTNKIVKKYGAQSNPKSLKTLRLKKRTMKFCTFIL